MTDKYIHDSPFASKRFYNFDESAQLPRHRWYYFKEGFSAFLVKEAITDVVGSRNRALAVLDPFCGSGTTPLVCSLSGHICTGIEVNPFLAFVSTVKTKPGRWRRSTFSANMLEIIRLAATERCSPLEGFSTFTERESLDKWLFNLGVLRKFTSIMNAIEAVSPVHRDAFVLAAIVAAFDCSNVKRDGKALRYKPDWKQRGYSGEDVIDRFKQHSLMMIDDAEKAPVQPCNRPYIMNADSRKALSDLEEESFDLVVTSPPYLNSSDYSDVYRPELFLGNYVSNNKELAAIRLDTVRSHIQVDWPQETSIECDALSSIIEKLDDAGNLWNARIPLMVKAYFDDLDRITQGIARKLRRQGQVWMVVSTSAYGGVHIPVDLILADLANHAGLTIKAIHRLRDLRAAGQQWRQLNTKEPPLRESLIILTKV